MMKHTEPAAGSTDQVLSLLNKNIQDYQRLQPVSFDTFLQMLTAFPSRILRNIFQSFHDMVKAHVDEYDEPLGEDRSEPGFTRYDCTRLFVEGSDNPYFPDMLFANRFMRQMEYLRHGAQQNRIYIFHGPHGCGKSTFLNNLLKKFEQYANTEEGLRYEVVWRLNIKKLQEKCHSFPPSAFERWMHYVDTKESENCRDRDPADRFVRIQEGEFIEVPCMAHDNPFLVIPKDQRRDVLDELIKNDEFKWRLFTEKEYEWVFTEDTCTVCSSIYHTLLELFQDPGAVFDMLYARPYYVNRRIGNGISVYNPGDQPAKHNLISNQMLQSRINSLFQDSNLIQYTYSHFARINNGVYALMDIKSHNVDRLVALHNIISEGIHKVEHMEERVDALFIALMNPEDKKNLKDFPSFEDRIRYIDIPYVLDWQTEVKIYMDIFGRHIDGSFLPMVLDNFARIIVCTRCKPKSPALNAWIQQPEKYKNFCDDQLMLLKLELFSGNIPKWLDDEDVRRLDGTRLKQIIADSEICGQEGLSGRDAIKIFDEFYSKYAREDRLINMADLCTFFNRVDTRFGKLLPDGFLDCLLRMYDYSVLQQVKESLYYYNEDQIARDIQHYISAATHELNSTAKCIFTGETLHVTDVFLESIENRFMSEKTDGGARQQVRNDVLKEFTTRALTQEIMIQGKHITETRLFGMLHEKYIHNLKKQVLAPFTANENFRNAIKDFDTKKI